jgi:hypothetical protein
MQPSQTTIILEFDTYSRAYIDEVVRLSQRTFDDVVSIILALAIVKAKEDSKNADL